MLDFSGALWGKKKRQISLGPESVPTHKKPAEAKPIKRRRNRYARLSGGIFRWLNEQLYTAESQASLELFSSTPEYFQQVPSKQYHQGFKTQVETWPMNPLDWVSQEIQGLITEEDLTIADLGCGEGRLALELCSFPNVTVLSYDLYAAAPHITVADIAHLPLPDHSVDIAVFCLSLMGKNHVDFLIEARRCLRKKCVLDRGVVLVAEVTSRIPEEEEMRQKLRALGLRINSENADSDYFHTYVLSKCKPKGEKPTQIFKACRYKPR